MGLLVLTLPMIAREPRVAQRKGARIPRRHLKGGTREIQAARGAPFCAVPVEPAAANRGLARKGAWAPNPDFSSNLPAGRGQAADNKWDRRPTVAGGRQTVCKNATKGRIPRSGGILGLLRQAR